MERKFGNRELSKNQEYFTELFRLLSSPKQGVVALAWKLLMRIETNAALREEIVTLGGFAPHNDQEQTCVEVPWCDLLDPDNMLKLLYCLQIVEQIVIPRGERSIQEQKEAIVWGQNFIKSGGVVHLHSVLLALDPVTLLENPLGITCAATLLRVTIHFSSDVYSGSENAKFGAEGVVRLLDILKVAATSPGNTPNISNESPVDECNAVEEDIPIAEVSHADNQEDIVSVIDNESTTQGGGLSTRPDVARFTINLLVITLLQEPALLSSLFSYEAVDNAILFPLLQSHQKAVRSEVSSGLYRLCVQLREISLGNGDSNISHETEQTEQNLDSFMLSLLLGENALGSLCTFFS